MVVDDVGALILEVFRLNGRLIAAGDSVVGPLGLSSVRWQILGSVMRAGHHSKTVSQIARETGVTRQAVQRVVNALVAQGVLKREDDPADRRAPLINATERGRLIYADADQARREWLSGVGEQFTAERLRQATSTLTDLRTSLTSSGKTNQQGSTGPETPSSSPSHRRRRKQPGGPADQK
ncbi:MarR family winged helix-turn-helix transcriptional regulator [Brevundimonas fontaquae]|uniref:MarR family transcriptional regulator n=1 Tax=Brevundimonas fontaquae TaxID=2813778 RepID=A0ABX7LPL4_9CAUL|nr:MarR family transcriptional regulator [Brevundimonas fontaquae]QSF54784.1 MarR family transcriptional regulator [Brevundimonas fontaquae]